MKISFTLKIVLWNLLLIIALFILAFCDVSTEMMLTAIVVLALSLAYSILALEYHDEIKKQ